VSITDVQSISSGEERSAGTPTFLPSKLTWCSGRTAEPESTYIERPQCQGSETSIYMLNSQSLWKSKEEEEEAVDLRTKKDGSKNANIRNRPSLAEEAILVLKKPSLEGRKIA